MSDVELTGAHVEGVRGEDEQVAITHYLVTLQVAGEPIQGPALAEVLTEAFRMVELEPLMAVTYMSRYAVTPQNVGLKDTWLTLTMDERNDMIQKHPHLVMALDLLCGVTQKELKQ